MLRSDSTLHCQNARMHDKTRLAGVRVAVTASPFEAKKLGKIMQRDASRLVGQRISGRV